MPAVRELGVPAVDPGAGDVLDPAAGLLGEDVGRVLRRRQPEHVAAVRPGELDHGPLRVGLAGPGRADQHRDPLRAAQDLLDGGGLVDAEIPSGELRLDRRPW